MSPMRSPTLVSGVASFSPYRIDRCSQATFSSSPSSAASRIGGRADRVERVLVQLGAGDHRRPLVEQRHQRRGSRGSCPGRARRAAPGRGRRGGPARARAAPCRRSRRCPRTGARPARMRASRFSRSSALTRAVPVAGRAQLADGAGKVGRGDGQNGGSRSHLWKLARSCGKRANQNRSLRANRPQAFSAVRPTTAHPLGRQSGGLLPLRRDNSVTITERTRCAPIESARRSRSTRGSIA